ncbi:MAG: ABC transporter permease [Melioribacteraceae bacterium]|nr:ABC transporter permease [Melioribacteraceae bacterium]
MNIIEIFKVSFQSLHSNKLRSSLTMLGIIVGIFSIIAVSTVISMLQTSIEEGISFFGKNTFQIQKWPAVRSGDRSDWHKYRNRKNITFDDYTDLQGKLVNAKAMAAEMSRWGRTLRYGSEKTNPNVGLQGVTPEAFITRDWNVERGRAINQQDINRNSKVIILGQDIVNTLFKNVNPIGQEVWVDKYKLRIIGVLEKEGDIFGQSLDNFAIIPLTTYMNFYGDRRRSLSISVMTYSKEDYDDIMLKAEGFMRTIRKVPPGEENDFEMVSNESILGQINDITFGIRTGAFVIAGIALLAAGVGIMNIMLVSVTERTKEIGIRKSIGAKKKNVLAQFLIEAITLCLLGGAVGIVLGVMTGNFVGSFLNAKAVVPLDWVGIGVTICVLIGVTFGTYPAYKAANLDPIEALRYE